MKMFISSLVLAFSLNTLAARIDFNYSGIEIWGRTYYSCDYAETQMEKHLKSLGAENINVSCSGGIDFGQLWPISMVADFDFPVLTGTEAPSAKTISSERANASCGLNVAILNAIIPEFKNVTVVEKRDRCSSPDSRYSYTLNILK